MLKLNLTEFGCCFVCQWYEQCLESFIRIKIESCFMLRIFLGPICNSTLLLKRKPLYKELYYSVLGPESPVFNVTPAASGGSEEGSLSVKFVRKFKDKTDAYFDPKTPGGLVTVALNGPDMDARATKKSLFHVTGMSCASCVAKIEREVMKNQGMLSC